MAEKGATVQRICFPAHPHLYRVEVSIELCVTVPTETYDFRLIFSGLQVDAPLHLYEGLRARY
jgi:hypothetical protein